MEERRVPGGTERKNWIDLAKGLAICSVVVGHYTASVAAEHLIYSVHLPVFFILAGYTQRCDGSFWRFAGRSARRLLLPCAAALASQAQLRPQFPHTALTQELRAFGSSQICGNMAYRVIGGHELFGVGMLWFLIALFWARLLYWPLLKYLPDKTRIFVILPAACLSMVLSADVYRWLPQGWDLAPIILLFMEFGRRLRLREETAQPVSPPAGALAVIVCFFAWVHFAWQKGLYLEIANRFYGGGEYFGLGILSALLGSLCVFGFCRAVQALRAAKPLVWLGRHSLALLCLHSLQYEFFPPERLTALAGARAVLMLAAALAALAVWLLLRAGLCRVVAREKRAR